MGPPSTKNDHLVIGLTWAPPQQHGLLRLGEPPPPPCRFGLFGVVSWLSNSARPKASVRPGGLTTLSTYERGPSRLFLWGPHFYLLQATRTSDKPPGDCATLLRWAIRERAPHSPFTPGEVRGGDAGGGGGKWKDTIGGGRGGVTWRWCSTAEIHIPARQSKRLSSQPLF